MTTDPITRAIEAMTDEQKNASLRAAFIAHAWMNMDLDDRDSEHTDQGEEALGEAIPDALSPAALDFDPPFSDTDDEIAAANFWRWCLNVAPLDTDGAETRQRMRVTDAGFETLPAD